MHYLENCDGENKMHIPAKVALSSVILKRWPYGREYDAVTSSRSVGFHAVLLNLAYPSRQIFLQGASGQCNQKNITGLTRITI